MTLPVAIAFFTLLSLGPIPIWHLVLHAFLSAWKRSPRAFYVVAAVVWGLMVAPAWRLAEMSPQLFQPPAWASRLGFCASGGAFLVFLWSLATLKPRRFFVWAVLRPEGIPPERIVRGPYRYTAHPTYLAIVVAVAAHFVASGQAALLGAAVGIGFLLAVVAALEQRELKARLNATIPEPEPRAPLSTLASRP